MAVLEELDSNKKRMDDVGRNARAACRKLDALRDVGSLYKGVDLVNGGTLRVVQSKADARDVLPSELQSDKNDNLIIACAMSMAKKGHAAPIVVSKDINVRVKCDALGVIAQDYLKLRAADQAEHLYTGVVVTDVDDETLAHVWQTRGIDAHELACETRPNQIVVIPRKGEESKTTVLRRVKDRCRLVKEHHNIFGLEPRNKEQNFALDLLLDPDVKLVSLVGAAGCGKTLIALAAGLAQTIGEKNPVYDKLVVTRPIEPLGRDLGYLPGTLEEKMAPWIAPIKDNLALLLSKGKKGGKRTEDIEKDPYINLLFAEGKIEIEAVTYIRGRSIPNSFIIIDEAQNLSPHELKTIITRSGEGTKIVLCGDIHQIDASHMDAVSNGLSYVVEAFKDSHLAGHVTLLKGERSELATLAADLL